METIGVPEFMVGKTSPHVPNYKDFWNVRYLINRFLMD
jgi:hypothetical protein